MPKIREHQIETRERERERKERREEDMLTWLDKYDAKHGATMIKSENMRTH
jgi:hypothetical protein